MLRIWVVFMCVAVMLPVRAANFDCAKATTKVEKLICDNAEISTLDDDLGKMYQNALNKSNAEQKQHLGANQRHWLKNIRNACQEAGCVKLAYQSRIRELMTDFPLAASAPSTDATKEMPGSWLRLYSGRVENIAVNAGRYQPDQPIPFDALVVQLRDYHPYSPNEPIYADALIVPHPNPAERSEMRIESYLTGESWSEGCLYRQVRSGLKPEPGWVENPACLRLREKAAISFKNEIESCSKKIIGNTLVPQFFVDSELRFSRCLLAHSYSFHPQWQDRMHQSDRRIKSEMDVNSVLEKYSGVNAYLHLETNRLFGCEGYGLPVSYWRKEMSAEEARQKYYPFYQETAAWQKQYLIKTSGFRYYCWDAQRILDEPEDVSFRLNDGTVLLKGNRSILRVREKDGATDAPTKLVKVFDPVFVRQVLDGHGAKTCHGDSLAAFECPLIKNLGWHPEPWNSKDQNAEGDFYRMVIQGVDTVLQDLFETTH